MAIIPKAPGRRRFVLTFDDGPVEPTTPQVLDTLARFGLKAAFFVEGRHLAAPQGRELLRRAHREGHEIGNHAYSHPRLPELPPGQIRSELQRTHEAIVAITGSCAYFRPPFGETGPSVLEAAKELGCRQIMCDVASLDWQLQEEAAWVDHTLAEMAAREGVILLHDAFPSTAGHLETFIRRAQEAFGDCFITLAEWLALQAARGRKERRQ